MTESSMEIPTQPTNPSLLSPSVVLMEQLIACQISVWYPIFSNLTITSTTEQQKRKNVTIRSVILPIPNEFIQYLQSDGLFLPDDVQSSSLLLLQQSHNNNNTNGNDDGWSSSDAEQDNDDDQNSKQQQQQQDNTQSTKDNYVLSMFNNEIEQAMDVLYNRYELDDRSSDRAVLPKFNWSAPKDSIWINNGSMKCCTVGDIYMLLKASDFISHDLNITLPELQQYYQKVQQQQQVANDKEETNSLESSISTNPIQLQLCLRKWCYLYPSQEFRCFVKDTILIGISQRHISHYYDFLNDPILQDDYCTTIENFYNTIIQPTIQQTLQLQILHSSQYTFDIYIDKKNKVWLVDFNVWDTRTDSLLFTWDELDTISTFDNNSNNNNNNNNNQAAEGGEGQNNNIMKRFRTRSEEAKKDDIDDNDDNECSPSNVNDNDNDDDDDDLLLPIFRVVEVAKEIRPDPLSSYKAPIDALHMASSVSASSIGPERPPPASTDIPTTTPEQFATNPTAFEQFMAMCQKPSAAANKDDDDDDDLSTSSSSSK